MSSHATEGAQPSAGPAGQPRTAERAPAARVEEAPAVPGPAETPAADGTGTAEGAEPGTGGTGTGTGGGTGTSGTGPAQGGEPGTSATGTAESEKPDTSATRTHGTGTGTGGGTGTSATGPAQGGEPGTSATGTAESEKPDTSATGTGGNSTGAGRAEIEATETSHDLAAADAGALTMVLDPEPEPEPEPDMTAPRTEPVSKLAIVALVTGLLALVPIAVATSIASLIGIRRTGRRGHRMAMAGLFLSAAWVIIAGAVGTVGVLTHGFHKPVTIKYREAAVFKLRAGDCIDSPNGQVVSVLPCSTPHKAEVFAAFTLPASRWPGTAAIATEASSGCASRLDGYLNPQLTISVTQSYVYPDKVAWTGGTRTVICEVRASSGGQLTGSVRGASLSR